MMSEYSANQIQVLEGLEAVRKRPGMYIGTTSSRGLHHLVYEIVDNAVDESLAGFCNEITVQIHEDGSLSVRDDGRGIPVDIHPTKGVPAIDLVFTTLHAGGKFGDGGYKISGGLHGVGASVVNALSKWLEVKVYKDGKVYFQRYEQGDLVTPLKEIGESSETGTFIQFMPDEEIFEDTNFLYETLRSKFKETAYLTKGLKINIKDYREENLENSYYFEGGIKQFVSDINSKKTRLFEDVFYCEGENLGVYVEISFQYTTAYNETIHTFVNNINTTDGGTHLTGFKSAITRCINDYAKKNNLLKDKDKSFSGEDIREGITAIVSIKIADPQFESQTKGKLGSTEARTAVESVFGEYLGYFLDENPKIAKVIVDKSIISQSAREAAKKARENVRRKTGLDSGRMPGKLVDCNEKDPSKCEIFIVEGNSAGGSAKGARSSETQAILPLRGKILNVEKTRIDKILANEEIRAMITAFGTGIGEDFDTSKLRYHKIVLMTDADVDGAHIRTLLLTFLFRYMRPLIEGGYVYIAQPPLYKVSKGKEDYYAYSDPQLEDILNEVGRTGIKPIQRYKGLGEMDPSQLKETTMDPNNRILIQVDIEDAVMADEIFTQLMGEKVDPRREFIQQNAKYVTNLDV
ncbi:MAG: DNA topoisomerase (ATP-hydrolyzing) subunit B [Lachnospirales bacterium]